MEGIDIVDEIKEELESIKLEASKYFEGVTDLLVSVDREETWKAFETDHFWSKVPVEEQRRANSLAEGLVSVIGKVSGPARRCPLLTEADERELSFIVKTMRAAVHLRKYNYWDAEVLHDEGTVLGVKPAGQSEHRPLSPEDARLVFQDSYERLMAIVSLLAASKSDWLPIHEEGSHPVSRIRQNTAFVMMWMDPSHPELDDVNDLIKEVFDMFGIRAIRADDIEHEGVITERILQEILTSEFLTADLTGARPSVYYEVGYAHALNRRVILYRKKGTELHFDLAGYNCPEYENLRELREKLTKRLEQITNKKPIKKTS